MFSRRSAQTSIEALLVAAALLAFFAALAPYYSRLSDASLEASSAVRQREFCDLIASKAADARLLPGSSFSFNASAPEPVLLYFDDGLQCNFSGGKNFSRPVQQSVEPARGKKFEVCVNGERISFVPTSE